MTQLTTAQLSLGISSHNNRFLFSDHYLNVILKQDKRWRVAVKSAETLLPQLTDLYNREKAQFPNYKESHLEDHWFKPIFNLLGHTFEGQASVPGLGKGVKYPDYVFFPNDTARKQAVSQQKTHDYVQAALAVGEVKAWDVRLGKKKKGSAHFDDSNPSYQIDYYLRATDLDWGILSNGRLWRLVHKESSYKLDVFFEIDLAQAIEDENLAAIAFFLLFFQQAAFVPDGTGKRFLDDALTASSQYALLLENDLRDNAYKALEHLIQGFIEPQANGLTADDLPTIYTNCLYLLYRIIFLFYGESRGLLPIENPDYQRYSITQFAREIALTLDQDKVAPPMTRLAWDKLQTLFTIIAGTQPDLNEYLGVPRYNGGLFNPDLHPFLEQCFVGDRYLHAAIDAIARRDVGHKKAEMRRENVDYRTLGVRQLGSIYEGLLEYQPQRATEPLAAIKKKKGEAWIAASAVKGRMKVLDRRDVGDIYLVTDKGQRKATGSYYTPDYIVKYIVEQTLGPLVEQAREQVKTQDGQAFAQAVLQLDVLDPAMGSGHFLVEATDFLARAIATDATVEIDDAQAMEDDDLVYWRRQVVEACIYGVDKNAMAVELAKLSLWLVTVARDRPLSFLDHHLRHGDSLVGARVEDLNGLPEKKKKGSKKQGVGSTEAQPMLLNETALVQDTFKAVGGMLRIETMLSDSIDDIYAKAEVLQEVRANLDRWRTIADLWTSSFFGNDMTPKEYGDLLRYLQGQESIMSAEQRDRFLKHPTMQDNDYFHWQLAFPEVFYNEYGQHLGDNAGFDGIIGNPPYIRQEELTSLKQWFKESFSDVYAGTADLFVYFFRLAIQLLHNEGRTSYISSNSWLRANYATKLRAYLRKQVTVESLVDLGDNRIFDDAPDLYPAVHVVVNSTPSNIHEAQAAVFRRNEGIAEFEAQLEKKQFDVWIHDQTDSGWQIEPQIKRNLFLKLQKHKATLDSVLDGRLYRGLITGLNTAFVVDEPTRNELIQQAISSKEILKPYLRGSDLRTWFQADAGQWLILIPSGWTRRQYGSELNETGAWAAFSSDYPAITEYLQTFEVAARKRYDQGDFWWELRACGYYDEFTRPKVFWPDIAKFPRFSFDEGEYFAGNTGYFASTDDMSLLGLFSSRCFWFLISNFATSFGERAGLQRYRLFDQFIRPLPVPDMDTTERVKLGEVAAQITTLAQTRHAIDRETRQEIFEGLSNFNKPLGNKLTAWWELEFADLRAEVKKRFKQDIPVKERKQWRDYLAEQRAQHEALTAQIVELETELNEIVYKLFDLTHAEIEIIETSTKYQYGEV